MARPAAMPEIANTGPKTSSWFRENEARLEAADTAHDRGNERQAAADLLHDVVDNSEPKAGHFCQPYQSESAERGGRPQHVRRRLMG